MTKIITCSECRKRIPARNDANVCGSNCRVRRWRRMKKRRILDAKIKSGVNHAG